MKTAQSRIEELQAKADNGSITLVEEEELEKLKLTTAELERQIEDQKILEKQNAKKTSEEAVKDYERNNLTADDVQSKQQSYYKSSFYNGEFQTNSFIEHAGQDLESLDYYDYAIKENESKIKEYQNTIANLRDQRMQNNDPSEYDYIDADIEYYEKLVNNLTASNQTLQENMDKITPEIQKKAQESFSDKITEYNEYKNALMNSMNADGTFDDEEMQKTWNDITAKQKRLYEYAGYADDWNKVQFDTALQLSDEDTDKIFSRLKAVKQDDTSLISEEDVLNCSLLSKYLNDTDLILEDGKNSAQLLAQYLNETYDIAEKLADTDDINWNDPSDALTESDDKTQKATLADLQSEADLLSTIQKELEENGGITVSSMQNIIKQYPEAKEALADYMTGIISEKELFEKLEKVYEDDTNQYFSSLIAKNEKNEEFFNSVKTNNENLFNELGTVYGYDVDNWKNLAQAKSDIDSQLLGQLSGKWAEYFNVIADASSGMLSMGFDDSELALVNPAEAERLNKQYEDTKVWAQRLVDNAHKTYLDLENAAYDQIYIGIDTSPKGLSGDNSDDTDSSSGAASQSYNLIERAIDKIEQKISDLRDKADDTFSSWADRNSAVAEQMSAVTEEINIQQQAYSKYMELANSVGLDDYYKNLIINGDIDIIEVGDEELQKQIDAFQEYYDKAMECNESVQELQSELNELSTVKFDNISKQFDELTESISHAIKMINSYIELAEEKNNFVPKEAYKRLLEEQQKNTADLIEERNKLEEEYSNLIAKGLKEDCEECKKLKQTIDGITESIVDSMIAEEKWKNSIQNSDFEVFDWIQEKISDISSEADFYINYIEGSGKDLVDENGNLTDEGITVAGLHAQNINTYLSQADDYAKKIEDINKLLLDDPTNKALIEQKKKYIDAQREAIISAQEERNAIIDIVKNAYEKEIESLGNLIDKYKNLMSVSKDAHDYEKSMSEKSDALASLQKQYLAWQGDNSETGMKKRQELEKQISDAKDDIEETQYEKMISDAEKLLDDLQAEYESMVDEEVGKICSNLDSITQAVNSNAETVKGVLGEISTDTNLPLTEAMQNIWNSGKPVGDINGTVADVVNDLSGTDGAVTKVKEEAENILSLMEENFNKAVKDTDDGSYDPDNAPDTTPDNSNPYEPSDNSDNSDKTENNPADDWAIYKHYYPQKLDTEYSVVDRLKSNDIDAGFEARSQYWDKLIGDGEYHGTPEQNVRLLDWLKEHGYASGTKSAVKGIHLTDEKGLGSEVIITKYGALRQLDSGDHVFNSEAAKRLYELSQNPAEYMRKLGLENCVPQLNISMPELPEMLNRNPSQRIDVGDININVTANNPQEFSEQLNIELAKNIKTQKIIKGLAWNEALGKNSLSVRNFL